MVVIDGQHKNKDYFQQIYLFISNNVSGLLGKHHCNGDKKCIDTRAGALCVKPGFYHHLLISVTLPVSVLM